jgi:hypothetical protein
MWMKKTWIIFLISQFPIFLFAQDWIKYYGWDQKSFSSYCIEHYDKGYILLGTTNFGTSAWIIKTDINGDQLWDIKIGDGVNTTNTENIEQTTDHGFILCGSTRIYNPPNSDPYIMKLNSCGEVEWCRVLIYDNTGDIGISVKQAKDGGYFLCGDFFGNDPKDRIRMFKFDSHGELYWQKSYNGDGIVFSEDVRKMLVDDSTVLLTGSCYYPTWLTAYYIQTDTAGNENWTLAYGQHTGLGYVGDAWSSVKDKHGNYYSVGGRDEFAELLKISANGYEMMTRDLITGTMRGEARPIHMQNDTTLIIVASWTMNGTDSELAIMKTDTMGNIEKQKALPNPDNSGIDRTLKTYDNKILAIGTDYQGTNSRIELFKFNTDLEYDSVYTRHFTYDSLCRHPITSHTITPDCGVLVSADEHITHPETAELKVYPNPSNQKVNVAFPKYLVVKKGKPGFGSTTIYHQWKSTILEVYDLSGKKVLEKEIPKAQQQLEMDVSSWPRGMYYFRLVFNKQEVGEAKVVVE